MSTTEAGSGSGSLVLVPLDGSPLAEQAIPYARAIAGEDGHLLFLQVTPDPEPVYGLLGNLVASEDEVETIFGEAAREELETIARRWHAVAPGAEIDIAVGDPAEQILRVAEARGCDAIVIASHGRGAIGRWTFGSVADRLARTATVPVMIVRPEGDEPALAPARIERIVVPHDGSDLAAEALPVAARLARITGAPVHLIHAVNPAAAVAPYPGLAAGYTADIFTTIQEEMTAEGKAILDDASRTLTEQGVEVTSAIGSGPAVAVIEDAVKPGDVVVMTSHGRSGVRRWLLGSVAEKLVRTGAAPVMLVPSSPRAAGDGGREP